VHTFKPKIRTQITWSGSQSDLRAMCARVTAQCVALWEAELAVRGYSDVTVDADDDIAPKPGLDGDWVYYPDIYIVQGEAVSHADYDALSRTQYETLRAAFMAEGVPDSAIESIEWYERKASGGMHVESPRAEAAM
jgi:hypothetical protein